MISAEYTKARGLIGQMPNFQDVDVDILDYISGYLVDPDCGAGVNASAAANQIAPFLESLGVANSAVEAFEMSTNILNTLRDAGLIKLSNDNLGIDISGTPLEAASKFRKALGLDDGKSGLSNLNAPIQLGESDSGRSGDAVIMDFLWGRENNAFLQQNKVMEFENSKQAKRAAKQAAKQEQKELARMEYESQLAAEKAAQERARMYRSGAIQAVTTGTVTYVPAVDRKPQDIHLQGVSLGYGGENLIEDAELRLVQGHRYGLVGRNGYGKTTLLKAMARHEVYGVGSTKFPSNIRVLHVEQEVTGDETSVLQTVLRSDVEREALLAEESALMEWLNRGHIDETAENSGESEHDTSEFSLYSRVKRSVGSPITSDKVQARLLEVGQRLESIGADSAEARASMILSGLQFTNEMFQWPTKSLSGGWRMRVSLACALFVEPDILLLDEPTNHLDVPSCIWLEDYLLSYPSTAVIVSHDRRFLNTVVTDIIHLEHKKLTYYKGDYDSFERTRAEKRRNDERSAEAEEMKRAHIQKFIDRFRFNAKRASLVQSRIKALDKLGGVELLDADDPKWKFEFPDPGPLGTPVLQINDIGFGYDAAKPLFRNVNFGVSMDSRIGILGPNGSGKSTLIKLILGELQPQEGNVARNSKLRMACFTQHHVAQLDLSMTPLEYMSFLFPGNKAEAFRAHLSSFGMVGDLAIQRIGTLSGGQKSRVAFAVCSWKRPHILILDEPTNHLDMDTIDSLILALNSFVGGVIVVSHDGHFIENVADELWVVGSGRVSKFRGEFKDYRRVALGEKAVQVTK